MNAAWPPDVSHFLPPCSAGLLSFLSPCVLPLVPPYLVYLAGTSFEALRWMPRPEPRVRWETIGAGMPVRLPASRPCFVALGASRGPSFRLADPHLCRQARDRGRRRHYHHGGCTFSALTRIALLLSRESAPTIPKGRLGCGGAYVMGLGLRVRLDAVHRANPGGWILAHRGIRSDRDQGARSCFLVYSLGLGIPFLPPPSWSSRFRRIFLARLSRLSSGSREGDGRIGWVLTGNRVPHRLRQRKPATGCWRAFFPALGQIG